MTIPFSPDSSDLAGGVVMDEGGEGAMKHLGPYLCFDN
jgi:hypothetical protein